MLFMWWCATPSVRLCRFSKSTQVHKFTWTTAYFIKCYGRQSGQCRCYAKSGWRWKINVELMGIGFGKEDSIFTVHKRWQYRWVWKWILGKLAARSKSTDQEGEVEGRFGPILETLGFSGWVKEKWYATWNQVSGVPDTHVLSHSVLMRGREH